MRVALKYCGACNPEIDLAQVGQTLTELIKEEGWALEEPGAAGLDVKVLLCGCPRTCIDTEEIRGNARHIILVAGKRLGWQIVKEEDLPAVVINTIRELEPA